jgi:GNAT superfamily N-acetyltransferase
MVMRALDLLYSSPEFDVGYEILAQEIPAEFLEERSFLRNRLRVRDKGPQTDKERLLVQDGYTLHLLAALLDADVVGTIYGHIISPISPENRGVGVVSYLAVRAAQRRKGIGAFLVAALRERIERDVIAMTGKPAIGMLYEIEEHGREEVKAYLRARGGWPLDVIYFQPALRRNALPERMQLWLHPFDRPPMSAEQARGVSYPADVVVSMVTKLLTMEYVGQDLGGFDLRSMAYTEFLKSVGTRRRIGFAC